MEELREAYRIVRETESRLRDLLEKAASSGSYDAVVEIAEMAKKVARLVSEGVSLPQPESQAPSRPKERKSPGAYPKFARMGDDLIKIGWSKSTKTEYEHKAPQSVALLLAKDLEAYRNGGAQFAMDEILPLKRNSGDQEIPDYQAYLCLAWLRDCSLITKHGRNSYSVSSRENLVEAVKKKWQTLSLKTRFQDSGHKE